MKRVPSLGDWPRRLNRGELRAVARAVCLHSECPNELWRWLGGLVRVDTSGLRGRSDPRYWVDDEKVAVVHYPAAASPKGLPSNLRRVFRLGSRGRINGPPTSKEKITHGCQHSLFLRRWLAGNPEWLGSEPALRQGCATPQPPWAQRVAESPENESRPKGELAGQATVPTMWVVGGEMPKQLCWGEQPSRGFDSVVLQLAANGANARPTRMHLSYSGYWDRNPSCHARHSPGNSPP